MIKKTLKYLLYRIFGKPVCRLVTKRISNDEFQAEMFITRVGVYDRTHAEWTMYESPLSNVEWLNIEWNREWEPDVDCN